MTAVALLQRAAFQPLAVEESWDATLLREAASLIGYRPKAVAEAEETRRRNLNEVVMARALEEVGIEPFTISSVEAYKALRIKEAHKVESSALTRYMHQGGHRETAKGERVVWYLGVPSWISLALMGLGGLVGHFRGFDQGWGWDNVAHKSIQLTHYLSWTAVGHGVAIPGAFVGLWGLLMFLRHKKAIEVQAIWHSIDVNQYASAIPAFAIQRMVSLKKALPAVTFSVQELQVTQAELRTQRHIPPPPVDPFLVAHYAGTSCYVDVWDEPRFEGRRTV
jgi:hypothetical protein